MKPRERRGKKENLRLSLHLMMINVSGRKELLRTDVSVSTQQGVLGGYRQIQVNGASVKEAAEETGERCW